MDIRLSCQLENGITGAALVPRQHSTGGKNRLLGISKRENRHLPSLFISGASAVLMHMDKRKQALGVWLKELAARSHRNLVVVALANKIARIVWAVLHKEEPYREQLLAAS